MEIICALASTSVSLWNQEDDILVHELYITNKKVDVSAYHACQSLLILYQHESMTQKFHFHGNVFLFTNRLPVFPKRSHHHACTAEAASAWPFFLTQYNRSSEATVEDMQSQPGANQSAPAIAFGTFLRLRVDAGSHEHDPRQSCRRLAACRRSSDVTDERKTKQKVMTRSGDRCIARLSSHAPVHLPTLVRLWPQMKSTASLSFPSQ